MIENDNLFWENVCIWHNTVHALQIFWKANVLNLKVKQIFPYLYQQEVPQFKYKNQQKCLICVTIAFWLLQANSHAPVMEISGTITMEDTMPMDDLVDSGEQGNNLYSILDQECLLEVFDEITTNYPDQGNALGNISNPGSPTGDSAPHNTHSMNGQFVSNQIGL